MVRSAQIQKFLSPRRNEVRLVQSGQREKAMHIEGVAVTLLWEYYPPDIATILAQCQGFAGRYAVVAHQLEVPYGLVGCPE